MPNGNRVNRPKRLKNAWVHIASGALVLFTAFVLLDTFAIARVQHVAEAADLSSIVAAQSGSRTTEAASGETTGGNAAAGSGEPAQADGNDTPSGNAGSTGSEASSAPTASTTSESASSQGETGKRKSHGSNSSGNAGASRNAKSGKTGSSANSASSTTESRAIVEGAASASSAGTQVGTYSDDNMSITVSKVRAYDTDIYVADIQVSSAEYLKTALAQNAFGRNLKDTTSNMAEQAGAVLAVNGDYYGFRDYGYVLRNGVLYRSEAASGTDALVVYGDGTMAAVPQDDATADELKADGAWQVLSFGPTLVNNGQLAVNAGDEVDQSMGSNPRTAIGMVSPLHYLVVVSDGRTGDNAGLSLYQLAQVLVDNGATFAYNLDGGGSTTLYFQGEVLNNPTSGNRSGERQVSDIVYFG